MKCGAGEPRNQNKPSENDQWDKNWSMAVYNVFVLILRSNSIISVLNNVKLRVY